MTARKAPEDRLPRGPRKALNTVFQRACSVCELVTIAKECPFGCPDNIMYILVRDEAYSHSYKVWDPKAHEYVKEFY